MSNMRIVATNVPAPNIYSDVNSSAVTVSPNLQVYNYDSVRQSILTIFDTPVKTRPFRRIFGCSIPQLLFDPVTPSTAATIQQVAKQAIELWEDRISDFDCVVIPDYNLPGYYVNCTFKVPALGSSVQNFPFNLFQNGGG